MTSEDCQNHIIKMQNARIEFAEFWKREHENRSFIRNLRLCDKVEHEITAWNAFLKGKGLAG